jgi:hypothetical protein
VLGSILGSTVGKFVAGGIAIIGLGGIIYILVLQGQVKDRDLSILRQQATIQAQASTIESLELQWKLSEAANEVLNERLKLRSVEVEQLTGEIEDILNQGEENDGPVAPVLDSILRGPVRPIP